MEGSYSRRGAPPTERQLLLAGIATAPARQADDHGGGVGLGSSPAGAASAVVKPGPSGTIASTATAATAAQAARLHIADPLYARTPRRLRQHQQASSSSGVSVIRDLVRAAEKTLAAGVGDWHLQALQDISPKVERHVLLGPLGPETLLHTHALREPQILQLYGLLHRHATGFQREVAAVAEGAAHREQLLAAVWTCFAQLWDECCQVAFEGEVGAAIRELQETYEALLETQDSLAAAQQENAELRQRGAEFVRANLDHMLAWRALKAKADALEGEVTMLSAANTEISLRAAGVSARNTQLAVQHEGLQARLATSEHQMQEREAALACARAALLEKDSGLRQLQGQVAQLEQQVVDGQQGSRRQDDAARGLRAQLDATVQAVQDAERRVADKQRAFNLLQADFAKQKADAEGARQQAAGLRAELAGLRQQLRASQREVVAAQRWRARWENARLQVEDLMAAHTCTTQRRHELVSSYWPVMNRLNQAEDAVAALSRQVLGLGQEPAVVLPPRDSRAQEPQPEGADAGGLGEASTGVEEATGRPGSSSCGNQQAGCDTSTTATTAAAAPSSSQPCLEAQLLPPDAAASLAGELQQLRESYLLLQDAYWGQKQQLLGLEVEAGQLRGAAQHAEAAAHEALAALSSAQQAAASEGAERARLEADLVGCRAWIRELERTEQQFLASIRQQGALEDAAAAAQREADDLRGSLASAASDLRLAQAAGAAAQWERGALLTRPTAELARSNLVEQALQRVHKEEAVADRAARGQLQQLLDQQATELQLVRAQAVELQQQRDTAVSDQQAAGQHLAQAQHANTQLQQQLARACGGLQDALQRLERLEAHVSFPGSSSSTRELQDNGGGCVLLAAEGALHLLDRLLVTLQCLAADAGTISMAAAVHDGGVLLEALMQGLQQHAAAAAGAGAQSSQQFVVLLRNATGAAAKQRCEELEAHVQALQAQAAIADAQLPAAQAVNSRLQRALNLKTRAVASLERQLGAAEEQLQQARQAVDGASGSMLQLQQELVAARVARAQLGATCSAQAAELAAACGRAAAAEVALQQLQANADAAGTSAQALTDTLSSALEAARGDALAAEEARSAADDAAVHAQQVQQELEAVRAQQAALADEVAACRHRADAATAAARDAQYRSVETTTLLADVRRELEFERCSSSSKAAAGAAAATATTAAPGV